jgi:RNA polymerase sigma-70 factor (ECF subfamily)
MKRKMVTAKPRPGSITTIDGSNLSAQPTAGTPDDYTALVRLASAGDTHALEELLLRAQDVAWRFSTSVCGRSDDAEDAMQEALIKTYRYVRTIREPEAFRTWLYRIVRNACLMGRRKKAGEPARLQSLDDVRPDPEGFRPAEVADPGKNPEQLAGNATLRRRLGQALRALPAPYRVIVVLRDVEGLSTREVAHVMGISEDNVKTRLYRARAQLQAALDGAPA